jgi:hypothetical protein
VADEPNRTIDELCNVMDTVSEPILKMTDAEIRAEVIARGEDPDRVAAEVKGKVLRTVKNYRQRHLNAAQEEYERQAHASQQRRADLPTSPEERRQLLNLVCSRQPEIGSMLLTLRHRDFEELTDADVESSLEELWELGALSDPPQRQD